MITVVETLCWDKTTCRLLWLLDDVSRQTNDTRKQLSCMPHALRLRCKRLGVHVGVTAVLTESSTDVLSHVAIRARSQGVLLASCFDDAEWGKLVAFQVCGSPCIAFCRARHL